MHVVEPVEILLPDLVESGWTVSKELAAGLDHAVWQGEAKVGCEELFDVGAADVTGFLDLCDFENLG